MVDFYVDLLQGIDLERFDYLVPILCAVTIVGCICLIFRTLLGVFDKFFHK